MATRRSRRRATVVVEVATDEWMATGIATGISLGMAAGIVAGIANIRSLLAPSYSSTFVLVECRLCLGAVQASGVG